MAFFAAIGEALARGALRAVLEFLASPEKLYADTAPPEDKERARRLADALLRSGLLTKGGGGT